MRIAIVGCAHGELDKIYDTASHLENQRNEKIDLIICCGDFQATRNESDLRCMAVPEKFYNMGSFYKYYSGECVAPILTLFIGGNHEASNYLQELPYGGWVAPNIYYMGYAGVINVGNIRIGGISGIFKPFDYMKGHYERAPFNYQTKRSVYHVRNVEVFRLKQLSGVLDVMLSHDWPKGVYNYGSKNELLKNKPFFRKEVNENMLGSQPNEELLYHLKPKYWFSAHLHTKFSALIPHNSNDETKSEEISNTKFLALDKCLPNRKYFEIIEIPSENDNSEIQLSYDLEWLTILYLTDHLMSSKRTVQYMPGPNSGERWSFTPTEAEKEFVLQKMGHDLKIPTHFEQTTPSYGGDNRNNRYSNPRGRHIPQPRAMLNPQTIDFCLKLGIKDPLSSLIENLNCQSFSLNTSSQGYDESAEYPTFLEGFPTPSKDSNQDAENADNSSASDELSNENSLSERMNDVKNSTSGSAEYLSFVNDSLPNTLLSDYTSTPENIMKKRKFSFPSFKEPTDESPSADTLPFEIDRTGNAPNSETPAREKKIFKRRNGNIYQND